MAFAEVSEGLGSTPVNNCGCPILSEDTIRVYETLFWNVRDRDRIYVTSLVYPDTRLVEFVPGYPLEEDPRNLVLRAAFDYGIQEAEELLGLKNPVQADIAAIGWRCSIARSYQSIAASVSEQTR